jgi:parallel beta-helix repeat protein
MKKQLLFVIFFSSLILSGLLSLPGEFRVAGATAIVYIRADGSVDPSTAPIQRVQYVYTFSGDVNASLVVQRDSIVVDGVGHVLTGAGSGAGVDLSGRTNVTVQNLAVTAFENGVYMSFSSNNTLSGNNITANTNYGINTDMLNGCSGNVIVNNSITDNGAVGGGGGVSGGGVKLNYASSNTSIVNNHVAGNIGFGILTSGSAHSLVDNIVTANTGQGIYLSALTTTLRNNNMTGNRYNLGIELGGMTSSYPSYDIDVSNTAEGRPIYYWVDKHGVTVPSDAGYIALVNSSNITVRNLNLANNREGVALLNTENCTITENNIANNMFGLHLIASSNNTVTHNSLTGNDALYGILVGGSNFNFVCYNNITGDAGESSDISFSGSGSDNVLRYNNLTNSSVDFLGGQNNDVSNNSIVNGGITLWSNSNATVCYNNLWNGGMGIYLDSCVDSLVAYNDVEGGDWGVYLAGGAHNTVNHNRLVNTTIGLELDYSSNDNVLSDNDVIGSRHVGVLLVFDDSNNVFTHNRFVNCTQSVDTAFAGANIWDSGYLLGGNCWSDYNGMDVRSGPFQNGTGSDGIGDTPYTIDADNIDHYPLMKPYGGPHDVGVRVSVSKTVVPENYSRTICMNVTIINYGEWAETFNFTCQTGTTIQEQTLTLMERNSTAFTFSLDTQDWAKGNYTLLVQASQVDGETDTMDNAYDGVLVVSIVGDINGDSRVDMTDVGYAARRFGIGPSSPLWNPNVDINDDLKTDMRDIGTVCRHFGQSWP